MRKLVTGTDIALERRQQEFYNTLLDFNYIGKNISLDGVMHEAKNLAKTIPEYSHWPQNARQFWNAEALCWKGRVESEVRELIKHELSKLDGKNLDLGSGSFSYTSRSVVVDLSPEMLQLNDSVRKITANLENSLPLGEELFDGVTMIFVASYIENLQQLFQEAKRVLKSGGKLAVVQSALPATDLHKMHYKNNYGESELRILLNNVGFHVTSFTRNTHGRSILFLMAEKII